MNNTPTFIGKPTTQAIIEDVDYFKSPDHYIYNAKGSSYIHHAQISPIERHLSYIVSKVSLLFLRLVSFVWRLGEWQNDQMLWSRW